MSLKQEKYGKKCKRIISKMVATKKKLTTGEKMKRNIGKTKQPLRTNAFRIPAQRHFVNPFGNAIKIRPIQPHFNLDIDRDGVPDWHDCQPFNHWKQDVDPGDWLDTDEPVPKTNEEDWIDTKKRRPKKAPIKSGLSGIIEEVVMGKSLIDERYYKNYHIQFRKHKEGKEVLPYPGKRTPGTTYYLANVVYAIGFEQDPSSPYGEKQGQTIGIGKTLSESSRNAKEWIDKNG